MPMALMTQWAASIESTWLSKSLFEMSWLWPACESLHFLGLAVLIGGAGLLDLRLLGFFRGVPIRAIKAFMPYAIGGFVVNLVTGLLFLFMQPHLYVTSAVWWFKVGFICLAGVNALFFETRLSREALAADPHADTSLTLKLVGGISLFSWFAVLYCGRMLPYLGTGN
jgi:hypothetical protein